MRWDGGQQQEAQQVKCVCNLRLKLTAIRSNECVEENLLLNVERGQGHLVRGFANLCNSRSGVNQRVNYFRSAYSLFNRTFQGQITRQFTQSFHVAQYVENCLVWRIQKAHLK